MTLTASCNFGNRQTREAQGVSPTLDSEDAPHWGPVAVVADPQAPAKEEGTQAPCGPDQGRSDWEGQDGEGRGGQELLCTYFAVIISLSLREQVLRDRQLVALMHVRDSYVFHGVDIGRYCDCCLVYMIPIW